MSQPSILTPAGATLARATRAPFLLSLPNSQRNHPKNPSHHQQSYGRAADVWSVGVIAYILLCGSPPFYGASTAAIFRAVAHDPLDLTSPPWPGVSEPAKDFVRRLLTRDPSRRPTAVQALRHEWIVAATAAAGGGGSGSAAASANNNNPSSSSSNNNNNNNNNTAADAYYRQQQPEILARLRRFAGMGRLRREALRVVAAALPPEEVEGLRAVFRDLDRDGSGAISLEELSQGLRARGACVADDELRRLVASVDLDGSQQLDWGEFLTATVFFGKLERHDRLLAAFQHFDSDGSGHITEAELREGLKRAQGQGLVAGGQGSSGAAAKGVKGGAAVGGGGGGGGLLPGGVGVGAAAAVAVPNAELDDMLMGIDRDGDGKISYEEFCALLLGQTANGRGGGTGGAAGGKKSGGGAAAAAAKPEDDDDDEDEEEAAAAAEEGEEGERRRHRHRRHHRRHHKHEQQQAGDEEQAEDEGQEEEQDGEKGRNGKKKKDKKNKKKSKLSIVTAARGAIWLDDDAVAAAVGGSDEEEK